jgi:glutamate-ammonia-ligase adenylyltransferase
MTDAAMPDLPATLPKPADAAAAARLAEAFAAQGKAEARFAGTAGGRALLDALGGNAPYLADLALREPAVLIGIVRHGPGPVFEAALASLQTGDFTASRSAVARALRAAKRRAALAIAVADIAGTWGVEPVTRALSDLAEAALHLALRHLLHGLHLRGAITLPDPADPESGSGFAVLAMGKLGAGELNYSSDIDLVLLFDRLSPVYRDDAQAVLVRLARELVGIFSERTEDGYVFRVDLRLRPDPAATPLVVSLAAALTYYESQGRTWERAALSKARPVAGDAALGAMFLDQIRPFIWRRHLDFAAIADISDMKRRIDRGQDGQSGKTPSILGRDVKLGRGGIREIEFIVQTLELVWGGHEPALRIPGTLAALNALARAGHLPKPAAAVLADIYCTLRRIEHRLQMVADRQTHSLPDTEAGLEAVAVFMNMPDAAGFARMLDALFETVHGHFSAFFNAGQDARLPADLAADPGEAGAPPAEFTSAITRLGFTDARHVAERLREWRGGSLPALRSERARALLDAVMPPLFAALGAQPDPDLAFRRFDRLLSGQRAGVQLLSLFQRNPPILLRLAAVLGAAPPLAEHLVQHPGALEALLAPSARFAAPAPLLRRLAHDARHTEEAVAILRKFVRREEFHLSVATLEGRLDADRSGSLRSELAQAALGALLPRVIADHQQRYSRLRGGAFGVVALGRAGAGEMLAGSDLDLMLIYDHPADAESSRLPPSQYFSRLAHALVAALTAPGAEGPVYAVDMRLRPSGNKGPVAVSLAAFRRYHAEDAWTWERMALTRARVMAATRGFRPVLHGAIRTALRRVVAPAVIRADARSMRARLLREAKPQGVFDLKHRSGGMIELAFITEASQLISGPSRPSLFVPRTRDALAALAAAGLMTEAEARALTGADFRYRTLQGMMRITGITRPEPETPAPSLAPLLAAAGAPDFAALSAMIEADAALVREAFLRHIGDPQQDVPRERTES